MASISLTANIDHVMGRTEHPKFKYVYFLPFTDELVLFPYQKHAKLVLTIDEMKNTKVTLPIFYIGEL